MMTGRNEPFGEPGQPLDVSVKEWVLMGDYAILTHNWPVRGNFRALEVAPVGRTRRCPDTGRVAVLRAPPPSAMATALVLMASALQPIRDEFRRAVHVTSWYRDPRYNATIPGSTPRSWHMRGAAADIRIDGVPSQEIAAYADLLDRGMSDKSGDAGPEIRFGIGVYPSFVHIDVRGLVAPAVPGARWGSVIS